MDKVQAVIMAGGLGTRLRPFTITVPKPLLPLGDKPIAQILLEQLKHDGFERICLSLGFMAPLFQAFFGNGERLGLKLTYYLEEAPLGTAGALLRIADTLNDDFLVMNGDTLTDISFRGLLDSHVKADAHGTIYCSKVSELVNYGVVEFDEQTNLLNKYTEKPTHNYYVSTGVYALSKRLLTYATPDGEGRLDMPDLLRSAREAGESVLCYTEEGSYWRDIGRFDHYDAASKEYQEGVGRFPKQG